ncbi:hypothetical protein NliqN6_1900 [Naganishia liquefaciens]|uniref:Mitogen-activated protein kinase n=1 Tax=Naganishia liquefaciens TaxID=104408 RepID=A0A8H3TQW5_9TREE|nr:hypothetical protein NliqN6_1900 [Naganishia liquefaciens]
MAQPDVQQQRTTRPAPPQPSHSQPRKVKFSVGTDYQVKDVIGEGAYGIVVSAIRRKDGQKVAIKKISPFDHVLFALRTLRELKLLKYFTMNQVSDNIISVLDIVQPSSFENFKEVYLVQELMETDLHRVIRTQDLSDDHCQYFIYQTCRALKALHSAEIVHRDLKPSNLLLNANCDLKVCDFGLARSTQTALQQEGAVNGIMTEYVATRWYRAPEVMLSFKQYTKAIDVWSIGCILAEMLNGKPLFPGKDYHDQLKLILDVIGTPSMTDFSEVTSRRSREYLRNLPMRPKKSFESLYPRASGQAIDFLKKTLTFSPRNRMTVEECLQHPYLDAYHDPEDEPSSKPLDPLFFNFDLQKENITRDELKTLLYDEIMTFRSPYTVPQEMEM